MAVDIELEAETAGMVASLLYEIVGDGNNTEADDDSIADEDLHTEGHMTHAQEFQAPADQFGKGIQMRLQDQPQRD